jgi:hypothetical protein
VAGASGWHHPRVEGKDDIFQRIARFEHGVGDGSWEWLGTARGLAAGLAMSVAMIPVTILLGYVAFGSAGDPDSDERSGFGAKICGVVWLLMMTALGAYWRRQRLAAHFQSAHRRLASADPDERQRGLTDLMINARRGWGEHHRIARVLCEYLRRAPDAHPSEGGKRQLAFSMLADQTLNVRAKQALDLTGAVLQGIRGVDAELPGVRLRGADLRGAKLQRANLRGADLDGALLEGTNLDGAHLDGASRGASAS